MNKWFSEIHSIFPFTTVCYWQDTLFLAAKPEQVHNHQITGQKWTFWMQQAILLCGCFSQKHVFALQYRLADFSIYQNQINKAFVPRKSPRKVAFFCMKFPFISGNSIVDYMIKLFSLAPTLYPFLLGSKFISCSKNQMGTISSLKKWCCCFNSYRPSPKGILSMLKWYLLIHIIPSGDIAKRSCLEYCNRQ